ncbi:AraC family transcriptional regulator [Patiriisocius marinus]|uniref:HTH araC/xylS-type domain-containing protein n=1 Tax=Patiriisocius marinus TaxID=1397112 RepID=A0A5J4IVC0_9FLAO|nr:AraC family transcriptional regulator [Patiriisocius marinus]GER58766.1 hypothetical protein ULMA_08740 [Patiriisocius marinus]
MKHFFKFFLIFNLTIVSNAFGQKDTLAGKNYIQLTEILQKYVSKDSTIALSISRYYINKAQNEKELLREAEGIHALSLVYLQHQDAVNSAKEMDKLLAFVKTHELEPIKTRAYQLAGSSYLLAGNVQKAMDANKVLVAIAEKSGDEELKKQAMMSIDFIESIGGDSDAFVSKYKKQLNELLRNPQEGEQLDAWEKKVMITELMIGDSYFKMKNGDSSAYYTRKALQKSLEKQDTCMTKALYIMLGGAEILTGDYTNAKKSLDYASKYCLPITKFDSLLIRGSYAKLAYKQGDYNNAIKHMEGALETYEVSETAESFMDDYYMVLADSYKELGDYKKANFYFQKHVTTTEQFGQVQDSIQRNSRALEFESFQNELAQLQEEKETRTNYLIFVLLGASIVIIVLLFYLLKFYKTKKANEVKFEALLAKINAATTPAEIIDTKDEVLEEKASSDVSAEVTKQILDGLKKLEEKEYFLKQECNSYNVAKKINTNTSYLSKVINSHYGKNFNTYINDLRINYAIVRLKNDVFFRSFSIQAIAEEVGYKSADSFTRYFKKDTGLNPSFYIKNIKNIT